MTSYFRYILRHRILVLVICVVITVLAGLSLSRAVMASSLGQLIFGDMPEYQRYMERVAIFGGDEQLIVTLTEVDASRPDVARLRRIVDRIEAIPDIARVDSVLSILPDDGPPPALATLADHPLAGGLLVAKDGHGHAMVIELEPDPSRPLERAPEIAGDVLAALADEGLDPADVHLGGVLAALSEIQTQTMHAVVTLLPLVAIVLLGCTLLLFRRLLPVLITLLVGALAITWTMGLAIALDPNVNMLLAIAPALILLIAFSDVVHLCSAYLLELAAGRERDDAILAAATEVGPACVLTSVTTLIGFLGLTFIDVPGFRRVGVVIGAGVAIALLLAMTLAPILFSLRPAPRPWRRGAGSGSRFERGLDVLRHAATKRPWAVIAVFAVVAGVSVWGTSRIRVETDFVARMPAGSRLRVDAAHLEEHYAGGNVLDVFVQMPEGASLDLIALSRFHDAVADIDGVGHVVSLVGAMRAAQRMRLASDPFGTSLARARRLVDSRTGLLRFVLVLETSGFVETFDIGQAALAVARTHLGDTATVEPSGLTYLGGRWLDVHIASQRRALAITFGLVALMMVIGFRSLRVGLGSMVPNLFPLLVLGGVLGLVWRSVDSDVAIAAVIAIGIAVDDTIHFLSRYRVETDRGGDHAAALHRTFAFTGRAIVITSLIFAAGFLPFAASGYLSIRMLGVLLPITMGVALASDLLLLPALITVGVVRFRVRS